MRGHVRNRGKNGKKAWVYVLDEGRDPVTGKRRQRWSRSYPTKGEAESELRKALGRVDVGQDAIPEKITVAAFVDRWLAHLEANDKPRPRTRREYERLLRRWVLPAVGRMEIVKVRPAHLQQIIDTAVGEGVVPTQLRAVLSSMFEMAVRWSIIATNPAKATSAPSRPRPKLTVPNAEQLRQLIEVARGTQWEIPMLLACSTGMRRSEMLGATWAAVDLESAAITVTQTLQLVDGRLVIADVKTARSRRTIPLPGRVVAALARHRAKQLRRRLALGALNDLDLVCTTAAGEPVSPNSLSNAAGRLGAKIGLDGMRLHDIRHGVATALAAAGVRPEVTAAVLGHATVGFTLTTYTHPDREQLRAAVQGLGAVFGT